MNKLFLFGIIFLASCTSEEERGLEELKRLCEKDAGVKIYKTVEADGYYDGYTDCHHCWQNLIEGPYRYIEFCNDKQRNSLAWIFPDVGCSRVSKVDRASGQCHAAIDEKVTSRKWTKYIEFSENSCIAIEPIVSPEARYGYYEGLKFWSANNGGSEFIRAHAFILDMSSGDYLSEYIYYKYNYNPGHTTSQSCWLLNSTFSVSIKSDFLWKTLITNKDK